MDSTGNLSDGGAAEPPSRKGKGKGATIAWGILVAVIVIVTVWVYQFARTVQKVDREVTQEAGSALEHGADETIKALQTVK
jgi:hypothetical protein